MPNCMAGASGVGVISFTIALSIRDAAASASIHVNVYGGTP
jgi:hypothetical protein